MTNPYASSQQPVDPPPVSSGARPLTGTLFGILNIVWGAMAILSLLATAAMFMMFEYEVFGTDVRNDVFRNPVVRNTTYINMAVGAVTSVLLIASGFGLLSMRTWGRTLANAYAVLALVQMVVGLSVHIVWILLPALDNPDGLQGPEQAGAIGGAIGGLFGSCVSAIYPLALLVFMNRREFRSSLKTSRSS